METRPAVTVRPAVAPHESDGKSGDLEAPPSRGTATTVDGRPMSAKTSASVSFTVHPITLSFELPSLESDFLAFLALTVHSVARGSALFAVAMSLASAIYDIVISDWPALAAALCSLVASAVFFSACRSPGTLCAFLRRPLLCCSTYCAVVLGLMLTLVTLGEQSARGAQQDVTTILLLAAASSLAMGAPFWVITVVHSVSAGLLSLLAFAVWQAPPSVAAGLQAAASLPLFAFAAYHVQLSRRRDFLHTRRLEQEKIFLEVRLNPALSTIGVGIGRDDDGVSVAAGGARHGMGAALEQVSLEDLELGPTLGSGSFGEVVHGKWKQTAVAVKVLRDEVSEDIMREFHEEAGVMAALRHPNIVLFMGVCPLPPIIVMELMPNGTLFTVLHEDAVWLDWTLVFRMVQDAARGMHYLHSHEPPILHRDLKSANLLVDGDWHVKVSDFGLSHLRRLRTEAEVAAAARAGAAATTSSSPLPADMGTAAPGVAAPATAAPPAASPPLPGSISPMLPPALPSPLPTASSTGLVKQPQELSVPWAAPELFRGEEPTEASDVYSFGIIMFELLYRVQPYRNLPAAAIPFLVAQGRRPDAKGADPAHSKLAPLVELMQACWLADAAARPSFGALLEMLDALGPTLFGAEEWPAWDSMVRLPRGRSRRTVALPQPMALSLKEEDLVLLEKIGKGSHGDVFRGKLLGTLVAVKRVTFRVGKERRAMEEFQRETQLMASLRHPNVVLFLGACDTGSKLYVVTELMARGSVFQVYHSQPRADEPVAHLNLCMHLFRHAARGMQYLHSLDPPLIHRDLKSPNILVDLAWSAKIADFGLSRYKDSARTMTRVGSPLWVAPEVLRGERFNEKCDVYSYSICMWELLAWQEPHPGLPSMDVMKGVARGGLRPVIPDDVPPSLARLVTQVWAEKPAERPSFAEVLRQLEEVAATMKEDGLDIVIAD